MPEPYTKKTFPVVIGENTFNVPLNYFIRRLSTNELSSRSPLTFFSFAFMMPEGQAIDYDVSVTPWSGLKQPIETKQNQYVVLVYSAHSATGDTSLKDPEVQFSTLLTGVPEYFTLLDIDDNTKELVSTKSPTYPYVYFGHYNNNDDYIVRCSRAKQYIVATCNGTVGLNSYKINAYIQYTAIHDRDAGYISGVLEKLFLRWSADAK